MMSILASGSSSRRTRRRSAAIGIGPALAATILAALTAVHPTGRAGAEAFYAKDEALALAFPEGVTVDTTTVFLTDEDVAAVKSRSGATLESKLFTYYVGRRADVVVGYAVIDTHIVRTLPQTLLAVLTPDGTVDRVILLAFYEPREYSPSEPWLEQFAGRRLSGSGWRLGHDLHGISGATLTARAVTEALRKIVVLHEIVMRPRTAP